MEYLRQLGDLVIDHRMRRIMEALLRSAEEIYQQRGLPFRPRWTSTFLLLDENGPLGVTEIAERIGLTHPGVIAITEEMAAAGIVANVADAADKRRRLIGLTPLANNLKPKLSAIWRELARAQRKRFRAANCDIVAVLNQVEDGLAAKSLASEVLARIGKRAVNARAMIMIPVLLATFAPCMSAQQAEPARTNVVGAISKSLSDGYIYEQTGRIMADSLASALSAGRFQRLDDRVFADSVTAILRRISNDRHLSVGYTGASAANTEREANPPGGMVRRRVPQAQPGSAFTPSDYGIERAEILPGNIAYMDIRSFGTAPEVMQYVDSVMAGFADVRALVIDLRNNRGGAPQLVQLISTYLFDRPTHLVTTMMRGMPQPSERWTLDSVQGKRMPMTPVYILTSRSTFSAGESFTFGLKITSRATIIGERTGGGGHFGESLDLPDGFRMFLPRGRTYDPRTNQGWEAEGIEPDVEVPAEQALDELLRRLAMHKLEQSSQSH